MKHTYNKILIAFAILILLGGGYTYFANGIGAQAADSSLASTSGAPGAVATSGTAATDRISQDTAFLYTLTSLNRIHIDKAIFNDTSFNTLVDNTVVLDPSATGRPNPFAPITSGFTTAPVSLVVTNAPTQITDKNAVLNGTTNNTPGVTSAYFEYGTNQPFNKFTTPSKQSLIGTFSSPVLGLSPKTAYSYRAVAKVNGVLKYGDVISFTTN